MRTEGAMSASPSSVRAARDRAAATIPVAGPPGPPPAAPAAVVEVPADLWPWWTPEVLKGWAGSLTLHVLFLIILGCWYFAPRDDAPIAFDSRLAGSPNCVPGAESLTGGLNTPMSMPVAPPEAAEPALDSPLLTQLELVPLEPDLRFRRNKTPGAGGGAPNDNPGAGDGDGFGLARFGEGGEV